MTTAPQPENPRATAGAWLATPFAIALTLATRGAVLAKVWAWFIIPLRLGVPHLSWLDAAGVALAYTVLAWRPDTGPSNGRPITATSVLGGAVASCGLLLVAFAVAAVVAVLR